MMVVQIDELWEYTRKRSKERKRFIDQSGIFVGTWMLEDEILKT